MLAILESIAKIELNETPRTTIFTKTQMYDPSNLNKNFCLPKMLVKHQRS